MIDYPIIYKEQDRSTVRHLQLFKDTSFQNFPIQN